MLVKTKRKIKPSYVTITGGIPILSPWMEGKSDLYGESRPELELYGYLEILRHAYKLISEMYEQSIAIEITVNQYNYPDIVVAFKKQLNTIWLIEVKTRDDICKKWLKYKTKFKRAIKFAKQKGWVYKIITDKEIYSINYDLVSYLYSRSVSPCDPGMRANIMRYLNSVPFGTMKDFKKICYDGVEEGQIRTLIAAMAMKGDIVMDFHSNVNEMKCRARKKQAKCRMNKKDLFDIFHSELV